MSAAVVLGTLIILLAHLFPSDSSPPQRPPEELMDDFTLGGTIPMEYYYVDDSNKGKGTHYKYSYEDVSNMIDHAKKIVANILSTSLPSPPQGHAPHAFTWLKQLTDVWLVHSLHTHGVAGMRVVVFGSTSPWYESLVLAMGALSVTTIEYNQLTYDHPNMSTVLVSDMKTLPPHFERALSLSSFDHDGLGRYGDPIHPSGDMLAMETTKLVLKDDGILFLTVPIGMSFVSMS